MTKVRFADGRRRAEVGAGKIGFDLSGKELPVDSSGNPRGVLGHEGLRYALTGAVGVATD